MGTTQVDRYRPLADRAAALEDPHRDPAGGGIEREPQRRWRRLGDSLRRTEKHRHRPRALGGELQAPERGVLRLARPDEHCAAGGGAQRLLGRP
jgi:hypothetical protein